MDKNILVVLVLVLLMVGLGSVGYSLFSTVRVLPKLSHSTGNMADYTGIKPFAGLEKVYFHEPLHNDTNMTNICDTLTDKQFVIAKVYYNASRPPDTCEIFIDDKFEKTISIYDEQCTNCPDAALLVDIKPISMYNDHIVKVCCDQLCSEKELKAKC